VEDLLMLSTTGVVVHDAFSKQDVTVHVYPCIGIFDFPMAAKFSNTIGAPGVEHCTSCDIVSQKTSSVRQDRAMNSAQVFDVRDVRYARIQERTEVIESTIDRSLMSSDAAKKVALHANGISKNVGNHARLLAGARGPGSFDVHEHVISAPSHLLLYGLAPRLLDSTFTYLSVAQRDLFLERMRAAATHVPSNTVLTAFEPEKMGGTTFSMADYVVLLNIAPTVLDGIVSRATAAPEILSTLVALSSLRGFVNTLFYRPTRDADGEEAVRSRPNVSELQSLGRILMSDIGTLATHSGKWDRPVVHRLLELLYRTLPIVQLSPALCELLFEKFHQHSKRELLLSNDRDPAAFSMLRWREVDVLARFLRDAAANGVPAEWLNNRDGSHLKTVQHHMQGASSVPPRPADSGWVVRKKLDAQSVGFQCPPTLAKSGEVVQFWRMARSGGRLRLKLGSTVGVLERSSRTRVVVRNGAVSEPSIFMGHFLVQGIATVEGVVKLVCQRWVRPAGQAASGTGQPNEVELEEPNELVILVAQQVKQVALVLPSQSKMFLFQKKSGFPFKCG